MYLHGTGDSLHSTTKGLRETTERFERCASAEHVARTKILLTLLVNPNTDISVS